MADDRKRSNVVSVRFTDRELLDASRQAVIDDRTLAEYLHSTAYEKATLLWRLGELINKIPPEIKAGGSINLVREWSASRKTAARVAGNSRSSVGEIQSAINNMARYWPDA